MSDLHSKFGDSVLPSAKENMSGTPGVTTVKKLTAKQKAAMKAEALTLGIETTTGTPYCSTVGTHDTSDFDPFSVAPAEHAAEEAQVHVPTQQPTPAQVLPAVPVAPPAPVPCVALPQAQSTFTTFLATRTRVSISIGDLMFTMPAIDVRKGHKCLTITFRLTDDATTFIPKAGTDLTVSHGRDEYALYYAGIYTEYKELELAIMSFIIKES